MGKGYKHYRRGNTNNNNIGDVLLPYYSEICKSKDGASIFSHMVIEIERFSNLLSYSVRRKQDVLYSENIFDYYKYVYCCASCVLFFSFWRNKSATM